MVKIDVCLWTKNGSLTLPQVLKRINNVIPASVVNRRFIVDDFSLEDTKEIASKFGYDIIKNCGVGVSDAANTALNNVETENLRKNSSPFSFFLLSGLDEKTVVYLFASFFVSFSCFWVFWCCLCF